MGSKNKFSSEYDTLRNLLREMRLEAGLRQIDLANGLGQHQSYVSKYESGERRLDLIELKQICKVIGISLQDLIKRFEELNNETA